MKQSLLAFTLAIFLLSMSAVNVLAYDRAGAVDYAESWWYSCNTADGQCYGNDCAAFVSKSMHWGGGLPYVGYGLSPSNSGYWWNRWTAYLGWDNSQSWSVANTLYNFLNSHYGSWYGTKVGTSVTSNTTLSTGDVIFYDWENDGHMDHVSIVTALDSTDPVTASWGDLVDAHSNSRHHAFWTLNYLNSKRNTTQIYLIHVSG